MKKKKDKALMANIPPEYAIPTKSRVKRCEYCVFPTGRKEGPTQSDEWKVVKVRRLLFVNVAWCGGCIRSCALYGTLAPISTYASYYIVFLVRQPGAWPSHVNISGGKTQHTVQEIYVVGLVHMQTCPKPTLSSRSLLRLRF